MTVSMTLNTSSSNISNEYRPTKKVLNLTLKKSIEQTLSVNVRLFGRVRVVDGGVRGTENMSGTSTDALRQLITCAKTLIAETAVAPLCDRPLCVYMHVCVCVCVGEQFDSVKSPSDRATYRSEVTQHKQKRSPHQVCKLWSITLCAIYSI